MRLTFKYQDTVGRYMAELIDLKELEERVILIAVNVGDERETSASLDELEELAQTAGAVPIARIVQNREAVHPGTYLGKGKILEVRELLADTGATGVICDDELSPAQLRNLEDALDTKVMDRTMVILDILPPGLIQEKERSRWNWRSCVTGPSVW